MYIENQEYVLDYIQDTGLISSKCDQTVSDTPDGLKCLQNSENNLFVCATEMETLTSIRSNEEAREVKHKYASLIVFNDIGSDEDSCKLFQELVPFYEYLHQCPHHLFCTGLPYVFFVHSKGSNCGFSEIIYAALVRFRESLTVMYSFVLSSIRVGSCSWVGTGSNHIPNAFKDQTEKRHASDLHSFLSYYSLSQAYCSLFTQKRTLLPARMIRSTAFVY